MNIGVYCNWGVKISEHGFYISNVDAKYILEFKKSANRVTLLSSSSKSDVKDSDVFISYEDISLIVLPAFYNYIQSVKYFFVIIKKIKSLLELSDFIYVRTPEPFCWAFSIMKSKKHIVNYHFTSNPIEVIKNNDSISFFKKKMMILIFYPEYMLYCIAAYFCKCTVNGPSVIENIPAFLKRKAKILIESTQETDDVLYKDSVFLNDGKINFLCVSRFVPAKGLDLLIDAFIFFKSNNPDKCFLLNLVGDGPMQDSLKKKVTLSGLDSNIKFLGYIKNGRELNLTYQKTDVFINPSLSETGPRVLLEAMSNHLFCISTDVGYAKYIMTDGDNLFGLLINKNSLNELVEAISFVFNNVNYCRDITNESYRISQKYTLSRFINEVIGS
ncbi:glycosyltransferase [Pectobacterium polaris]|uniref:glycosyltransferase n=1 Tax=Pectobacterium polaris TaxID=2042057 RepID=UPI00202D5D9F|nr:glycosyltransferase [Pectobacterium polaris]MCL6327001.1 glycosyltransferase [Pectobacterium polaris]